MDPILSKLLDLWDLDESSLSDHSLPGTTKFSSIGYLGYDDSSESRRDSFDYLYPNDTDLQTTSSDSSVSRLNLCDQCKHPNQDSANWCVECGTALLDSVMPSQALQPTECDSESDTNVSCTPPGSSHHLSGDENVDQASFTGHDYEFAPQSPIQSTQMDLYVHVKACTDSLPDDNDSLCNFRMHDELLKSTSSNSVQKVSRNRKLLPPMSKSPQKSKRLLSDSVDDVSNKDKHSSWLVTSGGYQRRWNSSSIYMWRTPSSIGKSNDQEPTDILPGDSSFDTPPTVPLLNLSSIKSDRISNYGNDSTRTTPFTSKGLYHTVHFLFLPDEIILMVLSNLSQKDLTNCMLVCRRLLHIASDTSLWKHIQVQRSLCISEEWLGWLLKKAPVSVSLHNCKGILHLREIQKFFRNVANTLKVFDMTLCDFGSRSGDAVFTNAAQYCPLLYSITFNWCNLSESAIIKGLQTFSCLEEVSIEQQNGGICDKAAQVLIKKHGKTLRKIDIGLADSTVFMSLCYHKRLPNLVSFAGSFMKVDENTFKTIFCVFPKLKQLTVRHYSESILNDEITQQLSNNIIRLESFSLRLSNPCGLRPVNCAHINQMTTLRSLVLDCVDDEALHTLCSGKLKLSFLDLSHSGITDKSFILIGGSSFADTLTHVRMSKCRGIDTACSQRVLASLKHDQSPIYQQTFQQLLMEFIQQCKRLRVFDLSWLYCVQDLNVKEFKQCRILI